MQTRMIIFLEWLLPAISSDLPKAGGPRQRFCSVLLRMGFTYAPPVTRKAVVSYTALPPLPDSGQARIGGIFLLHFPWSRLHRTLSGILPCEARTFLTCGLSTLAAAIICPTYFKNWKNAAKTLRRSLIYTIPLIFARNFFSQENFFARKFFQLYLYIETTSADKFTQNGILVDPIARHWKEIVQEFQQTLCL